MNIRRISASPSEPLHGVDATRAIEQARASTLPPFELMARAGAGVAQLARALAPCATRVWIACGPGNNGGDGLVAARHLHQHARAVAGAPEPVVTLTAPPDTLPADASRALAEALAAGVTLAEQPPASFDLAIDALLGIGARDAPRGTIAAQLGQMHAAGRPVLAVDIPSGLMADTGAYLGPASHAGATDRHTLSLLTLKPGLFTADGRDLAGTVWFDPLGEPPAAAPTAILHGPSPAAHPRPHAAHKGSQGDVVVIGGQDLRHGGAGMTGAAILAARTALHAGAGRVYVGLLGGEDRVGWDPLNPELMFRRTGLLTGDHPLLAASAVICGCGGGVAVAEVLPPLLSNSTALVLDADALNRVSEDRPLQALLRQRRGRHQVTVITPHPLEAARLLGSTTAQVMGDRLRAATTLSESLGVICVLKGSGSIVAAPGHTPRINGSGNPALATAGTGDVLAGWIGAALARGMRQPAEDPVDAVLAAVHAHGLCADRWVDQQTQTLTAGRLAREAFGR